MKIITFVNGMMVGMVIGLLIAPARGAETRRNLSDKISRFKNSVQKARDDAEKNVIDDLNELNREAKNNIDAEFHQ